MSSGSNQNNNVDFIMKAIEDTQSTIRFTDTKAAAVIGFWTLIITILIRIEEHIRNALLGITHWTEGIFVIGLIIYMALLLIQSIWLAYMTIVPRSNPQAHVEQNGIETKGLFYLHGYNKPVPLENKYLYSNQPDLKLAINTQEYLTSLKGFSNNQYLTELIYEQQKISFIRNLKIDRVNNAITKIFVCLIVLLTLLVYFVGKPIFALEGGGLLLDVTFSPELFIVLYIGHKIGDYLFQTDFQAINKSKQYGPLLMHSFIYSFCVLGLAFLITGFFSWLAIIVVFASHVAIDKKTLVTEWARKIKRMKDPHGEEAKTAIFELDQAFHYIVLFFISFI